MVYLWAFIAHWTVLSGIVTVRLWRGGSGQPGVIKSRMRLLATASLVMAVALLIAGAGTDPSVTLVTRLLGLLSGVLFFLGFAPPRIFRMAWRSREQDAAREATVQLMQSTSGADLSTKFLPHVVALVGGTSVVIVDHGGQIVASHGVAEGEGGVLLEHAATEAAPDVVCMPFSYGSLVVRTSAYTPFFGSEELALLKSVGAYAGMALDRARNVEALKASEAQLRDANEGLQRLTEELQSTNKELKQADEVKSQFLAMAAHELKTPLTAISGFAYTMLSMWEQLADSEKHKFVGIIDTQTGRLSRLVEDLLMLSRIEAGVLKARPQPVTLSILIKQAILELGVEQVEVVCPEDLTVVADNDHLKQIVVNYVSNAMKYGSEPITVSASRINGYACLSVCDHGTGVPEDFVPKLFERFSQVSDTVGEAKGTGLGLSIVSGLARAQGGEAWYEPNQPTGACFKVKVPIAV